MKQSHVIALYMSQVHGHPHRYILYVNILSWRYPSAPSLLDMMTPEQRMKYEEDGYFIVEDFLSDEEVEAMRKCCYQLVDAMNPEEHNTVFSGPKQTYRNNYFLTSGDKIRYFYEDGALDEKGKLKVEKHRSLNKIGHALHVLCPEFKKVTFSDKVQAIARGLGYKDPVIPQSMYIFKQPNIGGEVVPHQDGTFLDTEPLKVMGLWIALEDATLENGCLWFIPGSHKDGIYGDYKFVRNPKDTEGEPPLVFTGEKPTYDDDKFIATPVKKGSLIVIHGSVVHKSAKNTSDKSRHIYTFHLYDQGEAVWSKDNWLQATEALPFPHLYQ